MNAPLPPLIIQSPFRDLVGIRQIRSEDGRPCVELDIGPQHMNPGGRLHGGVVTTMIDIAGSLAVSFDAQQTVYRQAVTLSLTTSFTGTAGSGCIRAIGTPKKLGYRNAFASIDVLDEQGRLIAFGEGSYQFRTPKTDPNN